MKQWIPRTITRASSTVLYHSSSLLASVVIINNATSLVQRRNFCSSSNPRLKSVVMAPKSSKKERERNTLPLSPKAKGSASPELGTDVAAEDDHTLREHSQDQPVQPQSVSMTQLMNQWLLCTGRFNIPSEVALKAWTDITQHYLEPLRHYHTLNHLQELLAQMSIASAEVEQPFAVSLMIFFHDLIYDPTAKDNEERSAEYFHTFCRNAGGLIPAEVEALVSEAILHTKHHMQCPVGVHKDIKLFLDMDLAILGADKDRYMEYMRQIRREYMHIPHDVYGKGRSQVLNQFLASKQLFKTPLFYNLYEQRARDNLRYEITVLHTPEVTSSRLTISDVTEVYNFLEQHGRFSTSGGSQVASPANAAAASRSVAGSHALADPLLLHQQDIVHAISMNMDMCLAYRDTKSKSLMSVALCTRTCDEHYSIEARQDHQLIGRHVLLHTIATHKDRRGRGLASALLAELFVLMKVEGCRTMSTWCYGGTKQETFLKKQGFTVVREVRLDHPLASPSASLTSAGDLGDADTAAKSVGAVSDGSLSFAGRRASLPLIPTANIIEMSITL